MSNAESARGGNVGQFALCIEGLPPTYTWKDVKDLVRNRAEHGIRADVAYKFSVNGEQIPVYFARVTRRNEANNLYDWLISTRIEQRLLRVHFFEGSVCVKSNCQLGDRQCPVCRSRQGTEAPVHPVASYSTPAATWSYQSRVNNLGRDPPADLRPQMNQDGYNIAPVAQYTVSPAIQPTVPDPARLQQAETLLRAHVAAGNSLNTQQEEFLRRMAAMRITSIPSQTASTPSPVPVLAATASGAPINTAYGYARTEIRGVFVSGLDFKTKSQDVQDLFAKAGSIKRCQLHTDSRGNGKGTATIEFSTAAEATQAISALNNFPWRGRTLRVRSDREAVIVKAPTAVQTTTAPRRRPTEGLDLQEPTIVDGSNSRQHRRDSKVALA